MLHDFKKPLTIARSTAFPYSSLTTRLSTLRLTLLLSMLSSPSDLPLRRCGARELHAPTLLLLLCGKSQCPLTIRLWISTWSALLITYEDLQIHISTTLYTVHNLFFFQLLQGIPFLIVQFFFSTLSSFKIIHIICSNRNQEESECFQPYSQLHTQDCQNQFHRQHSLSLAPS